MWESAAFYKNWFINSIYRQSDSFIYHIYLEIITHKKKCDQLTQDGGCAYCATSATRERWDTWVSPPAYKASTWTKMPNTEQEGEHERVGALTDVGERTPG